MQIFIDIIKLMIHSLSELIQLLIDVFKKNHSYKGRFGTVSKILKTSHKQNAIRIGNRYISLKQSLNGGLLLIGKTGIGKSSKIFFQNLFGVDKMYPTSFICLDPTGELRQGASSFLTEDQDYQEDILNMSDASQSTVTWNPLEGLQDHKINRFASELVAINSDAEPKDPIWNNMSSNLVAITIRLLRLIEVTECINLYNVRYLIKLLQSDIEKMNVLISKFASDGLYNDFKALLSNDQKFLGSVISSALSVLAQWEDENVIKTTSITTLDIASYRYEKRILFIQNNIMSQSYLMGLNSLLLKHWFTHITETGIPDNKTNVLAFLIDEASSLRMSDKQFIPFVTSQIRKYLAYGIWGFQSYNQIKNLYTNDGAETFKQNTGSILYLGNQDLETGRVISQSLGKYSYSQGSHVKTREVLTPEEVMFLEGAEEGGILVSSGLRPMRIKRIQAYYENRKIKKWLENEAQPIIAVSNTLPPLLPIDELIKDELINAKKIV